MRNKDTGEFELIVGDKQLLTGFFIGMLLLGVVFAMGYVLGQNSPKSAKVAADATSAAVPTPTITTETRQPQPASTPVLTPPDSVSAALNPDGAAAATPTEPPPQPTTVPARDSAASAPPPRAAAEPPNAAYWQVIATSNVSSADNIFQSLKSRGFPASTRVGPNNLTVVWVGPYTDKDSLIKAKKQLEDVGMTNIIQKKP